MNNLYIIVCLALCLLSLTDGTLQSIDGKIKLKVGTTSGCGDTVRFITNLGTIYDKYKQYLDIEFIPWGRTKREKNGNLKCQFGTNDCWANRLQRCVLDMLKEDQDAQVNYMTCEFSPPYPSYIETSLKCAEAAGLKSEDIDNCISTRYAIADELEAYAELASAKPMAIINFVPFLVFNDIIDVEYHRQGLNNIENVIISALANDKSVEMTS